MSADTAESGPTPLLQIFHVTDLHFIDDYQEVTRLIAERRRFTLAARQIFATASPRQWHEGTLGHEDTAVAAFSQLIGAMKKQEPEWFAAGDDPQAPQTWIVDTGDATTFGDPRSLELAHRSLNNWRSIVGPAKLLSIAGNHDLWPGTQPGAAFFDDFASRMGVQRGMLDSYDLWNDWGPASPLVLNSASGVSIELYSIGTLSCEAKEGFLARGRVSTAAVARLSEAVRAHGKPNAFRVLASHHPFAFPFSAPILKSWQPMVLENPEVVTQALHPSLQNEPLIHMFLGGHTHVGMPGCPLPDQVTAVRQGGLHKHQVQLVGGPLLQQRAGGFALEGAHPGLKAHPDFSDVSQIRGSQQFQLLRFYERRDGAETVLEVERIPFIRFVTDDEYTPMAELAGTTELFRHSAPVSAGP
jgi:3',5'-cyclic AMP phosphodiesterase CpdA